MRAGRIPTHLGRLTELKEIDLELNGLSGMAHITPVAHLREVLQRAAHATLRVHR